MFKGFKIPRYLVQPLKNSAVVAFSFAMVWGYFQMAMKISYLDPFADAISNFSMTDRFYQMMEPKGNYSISIVDLTNLRSRQDIAETLEAIEACGPAVLGIDCVFEGMRDDTLADDALRQVARKYDNIVFSTRLTDEANEKVGYTRQISSFFSSEIPINEGVTNMPRKSLYGSIKRTLITRWLCNSATLPSFSTQVAKLYTGENLPADGAKNVTINFAPTEFDVVAPEEIAMKSDLLTGRIVLLGTMTDETDMHYSPLGKIAGVELLAYSIQTLIENEHIITPPLWLTFLLSFVVLLITNRIQTLYTNWTGSNKSTFIRCILGSSYIYGLVTFAWMTVLLGMTFVTFGYLHVDIKIEWAVAAVAFLSTSRSFYKACEEYYASWKNR